MKPYELDTPEGRGRFYRRAPWRKLRRVKLAIDPWCDRCATEKRVTPAQEVHHKADIAERPDLALALENLESLCKAHHSEVTRDRQGAGG